MPSHLVRLFVTKATLLLILSGVLYSQNTDTLHFTELILLSQYDSMMRIEPFHRDRSAKQFYSLVLNTLAIEGSFDYPFDTLNKIGIVYSPDKRLRILTWNIPVGLNENLYFGIIQYYSKNENRYRQAALNDSVIYGTEKIQKDWQKALYFQIIETKHAGQKYYTLLGFNFNTILSNKKSIDVLSIDGFDELYFCEKLFRIDGKLQDRIVFEYNEKAVMILRYDEGKKMIVHDHLAPSKPSLQDKYEFYGPDFSYDGFRFEKGIWVNYSNIDITN